MLGIFSQSVAYLNFYNSIIREPRFLIVMIQRDFRGRQLNTWLNVNTKMKICNSIINWDILSKKILWCGKTIMVRA